LAHPAAALVVYIYGMALNNSCFYDVFRSEAPPFFTLFDSARHQKFQLIPTDLVGVVPILWAIRFTFDWARRQKGIKMEDRRHVELKEGRG
jgi:steroid 5-alpha reductase family enzyme